MEEVRDRRRQALREGGMEGGIEGEGMEGDMV